MRSLHETTRRRLCRLTFVLICLLPTAVVVGAAVGVNTSWYQRRQCQHWEEAIGRWTGLHARVRSVTQPTWQTTRLHGLSLTDPEGSQPVLAVRVVDVSRSDQSLVLGAAQAELAPGQLWRLWEAVHTHVMRGTLPVPTIRGTADDLTVRDAADGLTFTGLGYQVAAGAAVTEAQLEFRVAGLEMSEPARITVRRGHAAPEPATLWHLRTGLTPLPCSIFATYLPGLRQLGPACRFQGTAWIETKSSGRGGELSGRFQQVDLSTLIEPFPHKLSGDGELIFNFATFRDGRLNQAAGSLFGRGGVISRSLIDTVGDAFRLRVAPDAEVPLLPYEQLGIGFQLDQQELQLSGLCHGNSPGTIVLGRGADGRNTVLLGDTPHAVVPAVAITTALSPGNEFLVPASRQTDVLLRALPLPDLSPPPRASAASRTILRLAE